MKKQKSHFFNKFLLASFVFSSFFVACDKEDPEASNPGGKVKFAILTRDGTANSTTSYLWGVADLNQAHYTNAQALEFEKTASLWSYGQHAFVTLFGAPATMVKYGFDEKGEPVNLGELVAPGRNAFASICFVSETEAYSCLSNAGMVSNIVRFDPSTMKKTGEISLDHIVKEGIPTIYNLQIVKRGNKLFMGVHYEKNFEVAFDEAAVVVIDIPTQKVEKLISDPRSSMVFHTGYSMSALAMSDNGDIYVAADGSKNKPSGILRIKNNEDDFDKDFFINLDELVGKKSQALALYGNNKALTMPLVNKDDPWEMNGPSFRYAKLDLSSKTYEGFVDDGMPEEMVYGPFSGSFFKHIGGEWLLNAAKKANSTVYVFDPASGSVSKKFDVAGKLVGLVELK